MNSVYLSPVRSWLRQLGVVRLAGIPARARERRRRGAYERSRPERVEARVGRAAGFLLVDDATEYVRALSFREDAKILRSLVDRARAGDSCWDVGANVGLYSILLARAVGDRGAVVAFEPEPRSFRRLGENVAANGLSQVRAYNLALGREPQRLRMRVAGQASMGSHRLLADGDDGPDAIWVDVVPGDELRRREGLAVPSTVKVDVEGAEEDVLRGMGETLASSPCRTVVCEVHFSILESTGRRGAPWRILEFLKACGCARTTWLDRSHLLACK